jgi:hypothetical protein
VPRAVGAGEFAVEPVHAAVVADRHATEVLKAVIPYVGVDVMDDVTVGYGSIRPLPDESVEKWKSLLTGFGVAVAYPDVTLVLDERARVMRECEALWELNTYSIHRNYLFLK